MIVEISGTPLSSLFAVDASRAGPLMTTSTVRRSGISGLRELAGFRDDARVGNVASP